MRCTHAECAWRWTATGGVSAEEHPARGKSAAANVNVNAIAPGAVLDAARATCCNTAKPITGERSFTMPIIDSQVHAYEANTPKRPWHSVPNWPDHVTGDEMVAAMDKVGVDGAIFISP